MPQRPTPPLPPDESWDIAARWYDRLVGERGSEYQQHVVIPGTLRMLHLRAGERVLDVACGQGVMSRALNDAGARVMGVDLSEQLVQAAKQRSPRSVEFQVADARTLAGVPEAWFDAAVFVLAAMNIDPVEPVFKSLARVLRPGGRIVMVILHPAFRTPRQTRWGWDEQRQAQYRAVDGYMSPRRVPIDVRPFRAPGEAQTVTYHRPLQAYVQALTDAGFAVTRLEEWISHKVSQPGPVADAENRARQEFPLFLAILAEKLAREDKRVGQVQPGAAGATANGEPPPRSPAPGPEGDSPAAETPSAAKKPARRRAR